MADELLTDERKLEILEAELERAEEERFRLSLGLAGLPDGNGIYWSPDTGSREEAFAKATQEVEDRIKVMRTERDKIKASPKEKT